MFSSVNVDELSGLSDVVLIDIRSVEKYNSRHIPGASNIPYEKLISNPGNFLEKGVKYCLYCKSGNTSYNIGRILSKMGYNIINLNGGYEAWILSGH